MKHKTILCLVLFLFLLVATVTATGTCTLDKENYFNGNNALLSCTCDTAQEENRVGYIVFMNDTRGILYSVAVSSGLCRTSFFGASVTLNQTYDYVGNASFSLNADGTGKPLLWTTDDINYDTYTYTNNTTSEHKCLINDFEGAPSYKLGEIGAVSAKVFDTVTGNPLSGAHCSVVGMSISREPLIIEPSYDGWGSPEVAIHSQSDGRIYFTHDMQELFWRLNATYLFRFHCYSNSNDSTIDHPAYDTVTGSSVQNKYCFVEHFFNTGTEDVRVIPIQDSSSSISIALFILMITFTLFVISFFKLSENEFINMIVKRAMLIFSIFLMMMNSGIMLTFIENANLGIDSIMVRYMWLLGWAGYLTIFITFLATIFSIVRKYQRHKFNERMGNNDDDDST